MEKKDYKNASLPHPWGSKGRVGGSRPVMHTPLIHDHQSNPLLGKSADCRSRQSVEAGRSKRVPWKRLPCEVASFPLARRAAWGLQNPVAFFYPQSTAARWKNSKQASDLSWCSFWNCILTLCGKVGSQRVANNPWRGSGNFSSLVSIFNRERLERGPVLCLSIKFLFSTCTPAPWLLVSKFLLKKFPNFYLKINIS